MIAAAEFFKDDTTKLLRDALETQGVRALENPLSAAAVHEAGHAVLYAAHGYEVRFVKVWRKRRGAARGQWVGWTGVGATLRTGPHTLPENDFIYATIVIAGVLAEQIFDHDNFRYASSLDEIVHTRGLATNIARKTGRDFPDIMTQILGTTARVLRENEPTVRLIAAELARRNRVCKSRLASHLASVGVTAGGLQ